MISLLSWLMWPHDITQTDSCHKPSVSESTGATGPLLPQIKEKISDLRIVLVFGLFGFTHPPLCHFIRVLLHL